MIKIAKPSCFVYCQLPNVASNSYFYSPKNSRNVSCTSNFVTLSISAKRYGICAIITRANHNDSFGLHENEEIYLDLLAQALRSYDLSLSQVNAQWFRLACRRGILSSSKVHLRNENISTQWIDTTWEISISTHVHRNNSASK